MRGQLSRFIVGALLVVPMMAVWPPAEATTPGTELTYACATKTSGVLRYASSPTCGKGETLVTFSVASQTTICVSADGSVRKVAKATDCSKKLKGTPLAIPSNTPAYFCVSLSGSGLLRYVTDPALCKDGETAVVSVNHAPTDIALSADHVLENVPTGTVVGTLSGTDPDLGDTQSFTLVSGTGDTDNGSFSIVGVELQTAAAIDFETQSSYSIRVAVSDILGLTYEEQFTITVDDVAENDPPTDIQLSNSDVAENQPGGTAVGTLTTTDPDAGDTHTYSIVSGGDGAYFQISGSGLQTASPLDHEGAGPTYSVTIRSDDGNGGTFDETFTITATDANDPPSAISLSNNTVAENQPSGTTVGTLSATDQDTGASHTFTLVAGTGDDDNGSFQISGTTLQTGAIFDYESDALFTIRVRGDDGAGGTVEQVLSVTVIDANDAPSDITLNPSSVTEGEPSGTTIGTLSATDQDPGDTATFSLVAGSGDEDNAKVSIDSTTLKTAAVLDFGTDPTLAIRVRVTDGSGGFFEEALTVTVVNVNSAPTDITLSNNTVAENSANGTSVGTFTTVDDPGDTQTYTLVSGTGDGDNGSFQISGDTLQTNAVFDFENDSSYTIRVRSTDAGGLSFEEAFVITITDANETPTDISLNNASVDENQPAATSVGDLFATDPDAGDSHTFSLVAGTGSGDNGSFQISGNTLQTNAVFNFEADSSYSVRVRATDAGGLFFEKAFIITITDINDAPTAGNDSYGGVIGNTLAVLGVTGTGPHVVLTGTLPLANDTDEDGDTLAAVVENVTSTGGGTAAISADGSFTFLPGVGDKNQNDTFSYHVTDGILTSAGTVTVTILNELVWYVDDSAAPGDGRSTAPFNTLTPIAGQGADINTDADSTGDWIFLYSGSYGPLLVETSQKLYGQPAGLVVSGTTLVAAGGTNPVINAPVGGNGLLLLNQSAVRAVNVVGNTNGAAVSIAANSASLGGTEGGTVTVTNGTYGVVVGAGSGTVTIQANITNTTGGAARVSGRTSGSVTFQGNLAASGVAVVPTSGVDLINNTGATISFNGALTLNTAAQPGFSATGGGTVTASGAGSTVTTTTGTPVTIQNTGIGAGGVAFRSVSSNGAANGIVLQNTGTAGSFTVTGNSAGTCGGVVSNTGGLTSGPDLADCTGGTILNSTGTGVLLSSTHGVSLTRVRVDGSDADGIGGTSLTGGFTLVNSVVSSNGDAAEENGIDLGDSAAVTPQGVTGTVTIDNNTITGSADSNVIINNGSGAASIGMDHNRIANADSVVGSTQENIQVEAAGPATIGLTISANSLAAAKGDHVQVNAANGAGGAGGTFTSAGILNNTMSGGAAGALAQGVTISAAGQAPLWAGSVTYDVNGNVINGAVTHAVTISMGASGASGVFSGFVRNNVIGTTGQALSCSSQGNGIFVKAEGSGTSTVAIQGNVFRRCFDRGIDVTGRDGNGVLNATVTGNTVTEMSDTNNVTFTPREAFQLIAGSTSANILGGVDQHTVCLHLNGNTLTGGAHKISDVRARQRFQTRVSMPGYAGTAFDSAAVQAFLSGNNGGATTTATSNDDGAVITDGYFNTSGGGPCPLPAS